MIQTPHNTARAKLMGTAWKLVACLAFALVNVMVRYLTGGSGADHHLSPTVVTLFEYIFAASIMLPVLLYRAHGDMGAFKTRYVKKHLIRLVAAASGVIMFYAALQAMPISQAVALQFTGPLFSVIGARVYLKEQIGYLRGLGILLGILGAFVITRPDISLQQGHLDYVGFAVLLPIFSAILFVVAKLMGRELAHAGEKTELLTAYLLLFMIPSSLLLALGDLVLPSAVELAMLCALGLFGLLAHYATARAFRYAEVLFLMPIGFARLLFSAVLALILFGEYPKSPLALPGMVMIFISVCVITYGESRGRTRDKRRR